MKGSICEPRVLNVFKPSTVCLCFSPNLFKNVLMNAEEKNVDRSNRCDHLSWIVLYHLLGRTRSGPVPRFLINKLACSHLCHFYDRVGAPDDDNMR